MVRALRMLRWAWNVNQMSNKECMHYLDRESCHLEDGERDESVIDSRSKLLRCSMNRIELAQDRPMSMSMKRINGQCDEES
jgi:hypothetical protein